MKLYSIGLTMLLVCAARCSSMPMPWFQLLGLDLSIILAGIYGYK